MFRQVFVALRCNFYSCNFKNLLLQISIFACILFDFLRIFIRFSLQCLSILFQFCVTFYLCRFHFSFSTHRKIAVAFFEIHFSFCTRFLNFCSKFALVSLQLRCTCVAIFSIKISFVGFLELQTSQLLSSQLLNCAFYFEFTHSTTLHVTFRISRAQFYCLLFNSGKSQ